MTSDIERGKAIVERGIYAPPPGEYDLPVNGTDPDDPGPTEPPVQEKKEKKSETQDNGAGVMCVRKASTLDKPKRKRWLAKNRIPLRDVTVLVGEEGIGKSLFWVLVVAAVTRGTAVPDFGIPARNPADVLLILTEDDWSTDVLPRLQLAGADIDRISVLSDSPDGSGSPEFPRHINHVLTAEPRPVLVVVDAWLDTVDPRLQVRDPQQARRALHPWRRVATQIGAAVSLLSHTNRLVTGNTRDLYGATGALRQKARMTLFAQEDSEGFLTIGPDKANSTQTGTLATRFAITKVQVYEPTEDDDGTVPMLRTEGFSDKTAREIAVANHLAQQSGSDEATADVPSHLQEFADLLREYIVEGEPCPSDWPSGHRRLSKDVYKAAEAAGGSKDKAKKVKAGIGAFAKHGDDDCWYWVIPPTAGESDDGLL